MAADASGPKGPGMNFELEPEALGNLIGDATANVVEVVGVIKWFDVSKGYGFIVPDSGMADVLLHVTCLRRDGYQTAYEGARIVCEALQRPKGLQAFRVLSMDESTAVHPAQMPPPRTHVTVTPTSGLERAIVKWFDASKGYGFIVPDNGWPDVLLHVTVLRRDGYQTAYEGARLVVECVQRAKGYQAFRIVSMDESTAIHPAQMLPPRTHVSVTPTSGLERAQVKWFNRLRGFGFLTCGEGTPDIFVHMETLRRFGMTELRPGQYVLVRFGPGSKGMMAAEIQPETGSPGLSSH